MKKRVRLHQLRVGMYVEEIETGPKSSVLPGTFLIKTDGEIQKIMDCNAMSAVINVRKGSDVDEACLPPIWQIRRSFEANLLRNYSARDVARAKAAIKRTAPNVKQLLLSVHTKDAIDVVAASSSVEEIMTFSGDHAGALISLSKLKEKDEETFLHSISVSALLIAFGRRLKLDDDTIRQIGLGGLLHDVGKMAIPTEILRKSGTLTDQERTVVRLHPCLGFDLLKRAAILPTSALEICLHHHERYDGSGYPNGLEGKAIPYVARLAAICDVYDALTTLRPYKKAWSQAEAIEIMLRSPGQFDPTLLRLFVSSMVLSGDLS